MATDRVEVDPQKLRRASEQTAELSTKVTAIADRLRNTLAGIESDATTMPWGDDKRGRKFAQGDKGYQAARKNLLDGAAGAAQTLDDMSDGQRQAADALGGTDHASSGQFREK
ncbi:hypothetical protein [Nocardia amamiensis]|uniref:hypothetical protein n=1 Tax=Nocardia amamiensis TaxID=404578 RepID=UPI00082DA8BC|nr:hypothetical protein [Nocardia amamiensis]